MNVLVCVRTYRGGAAQRWQRLSGNGSSSGTATSLTRRGLPRVLRLRSFLVGHPGLLARDVGEHPPLARAQREDAVLEVALLHFIFEHFARLVERHGRAVV